MIRRYRLWRVVAWLFILLNLGGAAVAAARIEVWHAALHVVLAIAGVYALRWLGTRSGRQDSVATPSPEERLDNLQQSLDAIAIEVERIGEGQRFITKLQQERSEAKARR